MTKQHALIVLLLLLCLMVVVGATASAQSNFEIGAGYGYVSGNGGMNGFNANAAMFFTHRVAIAADYDGIYDTSSLGLFQVTPIGNVTSKNHLQDFLIGPRIYFPTLIKSKNKTINLLTPFAEVQLGASHLNSEIIQSALGTRTGTNDSGFTWMVGGGTDYRLTSRWAARGKVDLLRTHLADSGQSRVRFVLGVAYFFKERK